MRLAALIIILVFTRGIADAALKCEIDADRLKADLILNCQPLGESACKSCAGLTLTEATTTSPLCIDRLTEIKSEFVQDSCQ